MDCFLLVNPGLEQLAQQELEELVKTKASISGQALEFSLPGNKELIALCTRGQSFRRLLVLIEKFSKLEEFDVDKIDFPWPDYFPPQFSFKIEVEGVKGQENRFQLVREGAQKLFPCWEKKRFTPTLDVKKGQFSLVLYWTGRHYLLGIDCIGEVDARSYRLFPHQATFKGDLAYYFIRQSGFKPKEKLLIGFVRDGGLAIEAALYANKLPGRQVVKVPRSAFPLPQLPQRPLKQKKISSPIISFDPNRQNIIAAQKNGRIAGVTEAVEFHRYSLDELDTRFSPEEFDRIIIHLTRKDEEKINELFYQCNYVLEKAGHLFIIGRTGLELPVPENYGLVKEQEIQRGESTYKWWLMKKKG